MRIITSKNTVFNFIYSDSAKCWMSTGKINELEVDFEIYEEEYLQEKIDWQYFKKFVDILEKKDSLPFQIAKSQKLLLNLADAFGASINKNEKIEDFQMDFVGLSFKGEVNSLFIKAYAHSLWFKISNTQSESQYVDPYGNFITDFEAGYLLGARREQC
jgi:hypothetical protein